MEQQRVDIHISNFTGVRFAEAGDIKRILPLLVVEEVQQKAEVWLNAHLGQDYMVVIYEVSGRVAGVCGMEIHAELPDGEYDTNKYGVIRQMSIDSSFGIRDIDTTILGYLISNTEKLGLNRVFADTEIWKKYKSMRDTVILAVRHRDVLELFSDVVL
jgi:N-acetylglutamate synthase-like GNAT family acetyltransferase